MKKAISLVILLCSVLSFSQQKYQSLLWEITGNGLKETSYLYGTMHVSKKVAFRLDDVFYKALNASECIALESDPTTWPGFNYDIMLNEMSYYGSNRGSIYQNLFKLSHPEKMTIRGSIRMDNNAVNAYLYRKNNATDNFEEETYLDMFIFQAGKKNNKEIIALEDLEESRYLTSKAMYNANKKDIDPWLQKLFAKENRYLIQENLYRDRNLDLLDSIGAGVNTEFNRKHMLFIRNKNMVDALVKLMPKKSVFAGVGAAHLPGDKGMIHMLRERGYTVKALTSKQTDYSKTEKSKLDSLFIAPKLSKSSTNDGFLTINTNDTLREFPYQGHNYYLDPDMANGAYIIINRISKFSYLPNEKENITLKEIDNLLFEDIPGDIIKKEAITEPYPGISIVNKTKKGEFQSYHIYETPLEIITIKYAGRSDFVLKHRNKVFNSINFKTPTNVIKTYTAPHRKFTVDFPEYYITSNAENHGKKILQGYKDEAYYFVQEAVLHDVKYIEEDAFEAKYLHKALYKNYKLKETNGEFKNKVYKSYESSAIIDSTSNKSLALKTIIKDGSYYLLGYVGANEKEKSSFFNSFKFEKTEYSGFRKYRDTTLHFSVVTNTKPPAPTPNGYASDKIKEYEEVKKNTVYATNTNEKITISKTKFHDLQMFHNIDSLWNSQENKIYYSRYNYSDKKFKLSEKSKQEKDSVYSFSFSYSDSLSAKKVMVKNILKKGVLFELKTLVDSTSGPSEFVKEFYSSFTPSDTLLGESVLKDKTQRFFKALKEKDSITLESYDLIKFKKQHSKALVLALKNTEFEKERLKIKAHLVEKLIEVDLNNNIKFLKTLYFDSYSDPKTQTAILDGLLESKSKEGNALVLDLMERDIPIGNNVSRIFYSYKGDSLELKAQLFPKILDYSTIEEYKQPIYNLLSKLKDSSVVKPTVYTAYKNQIINDAKIEVKRSLSQSTKRYKYYSKDLTTYVNLIFPYRKERAAQDFFEKLLNVDDTKALVKYHVLLAQNKIKIPKGLKEKTLEDEEKLFLTLEELNEAKLLEGDKSIKVTQEVFAKSKLLDKARFEKEKDSVNFLMKRYFRTDKGKDAVMYFFKIDKESEYSGKTEVLHYIAFLKPEEPETLVVDYYYKSANSGTTIDETKELDDQYDEIINLAKYKNRKRVTKSTSRYDYY